MTQVKSCCVAFPHHASQTMLIHFIFIMWASICQCLFREGVVVRIGINWICIIICSHVCLRILWGHIKITIILSFLLSPHWRNLKSVNKIFHSKQAQRVPVHIFLRHHHQNLFTNSIQVQNQSKWVAGPAKSVCYFSVSKDSLCNCSSYFSLEILHPTRIQLCFLEGAPSSSWRVLV